MAESEQLYFRAGEELQERVDWYQAERGHDDRSSALRELVEVGLRESSVPLIYRFKDQVIRSASDLGVFAVLVLLAGFTTPVISPNNAAVFAIGLVFTSMFLIGAMELVRVVSGSNEIGSAFREVFGRDSA